MNVHNGRDHASSTAESRQGKENMQMNKIHPARRPIVKIVGRLLVDNEMIDGGEGENEGRKEGTGSCTSGRDSDSVRLSSSQHVPVVDLEAERRPRRRLPPRVERGERVRRERDHEAGGRRPVVNGVRRVGVRVAVEGAPAAVGHRRLGAAEPGRGGRQRHRYMGGLVFLYTFKLKS